MLKQQAWRKSAQLGNPVDRLHKDADNFGYGANAVAFASPRCLSADSFGPAMSEGWSLMFNWRGKARGYRR